MIEEPPPPPPRRSRYTPTESGFGIVTACLMVADASCVVLSFFVARYLYMLSFFDEIRKGAFVGGQFASQEITFYLFGCGVALFLVMTFGWLGVYHRGVSVLAVEEDVNMLKGILLTAMMSFALSFVIQPLPIPRLALGLAMVIAGPLLVGARRMIRRLSAWFLSAGVGAEPVVIYGAGDMGQQLADRLYANPQLGLLPVGFLDPHSGEGDGWITFGASRKNRLPLLGDMRRIDTIVEMTDAHYVFVAVDHLDSEHLAEVQSLCRDAGVHCYYAPLFSAAPFRRINMTFVGDIPLIYERALTDQFSHRIIKRTFDLFVSAFLLVILSPLFLFIALGIKISSRGPVFFVQERIGRYGAFFNIYKFRTMHVEAPAYANKLDHDRAMIFSFGRILRKSSLDELPQLMNVLRGQMSLVGPRPDMPYIVKSYNPVQRERLLATPGITGLWQISADRNTPIHENIDYDLYYIYNQSFLLDLVILARTAFCLFGGR